MDAACFQSIFKSSVAVVNRKEKYELAQLAAMAEAMKQRQRLLASYMVKNSSGPPVLLQYSADGTPLK
eukprot:901273-Karenia_brevis.AAC.1